MLQAHSFLWHYLWVAPNVFLLILALLMWRRGLHAQFPAFFCFAVLGSLSQLALYSADVVPSVSAETFWRADWVRLVIEGTLKFVLIGKIFASAFGLYPSVARIGRTAIRTMGVALIFSAAIAAAYTRQDGRFGIVSGAHILELTIYMIESGLLVLIFALSFFFRLSLSRQLFGIALGLSISSCVHLASWAVLVNGNQPDSIRYDLDFLNMAVYHGCVLLWFYFLLAPQTPAAKAGGSSASPMLTQSEHLADWNKELERLVH
jgi:hypothetical protein